MEQKILSIELADRYVRYLYLEKEQTAYRILRAGQAEMGLAYFQPGALTKAVQSLLENEKIRPQAVSVVLSCHHLLMGQILLPASATLDGQKAVEKEIHKVHSKNPEDLKILYGVYPVNADSVRVVFSAVPQSLLQWIRQEISRLRIPLKGIDFSPFHLKDTLVQWSLAFSDGMAYLVVQPERSVLAVVQNADYRLFYASSIGADLLSAGSSDATYEEIYQKWAQELKRVLEAFAAKNPDLPVRGLSMMWDKVLLPDLDERLAKNLELDIEVLYLKKFKEVKITEESQMNPIFAPLLCNVLEFWRKRVKEPAKPKSIPVSSPKPPRAPRPLLPVMVAVSLLLFFFAAWVLGIIFFYRKSHQSFFVQEIRKVESKLSALEHQQQLVLEDYRRRVAQQDWLDQQQLAWVSTPRVAWGYRLQDIRENVNEARLEQVKVNSKQNVTVHVRAVWSEDVESLLENFKILSWVKDVEPKMVRRLASDDHPWLIGLAITSKEK